MKTVEETTYREGFRCPRIPVSPGDAPDQSSAQAVSTFSAVYREVSLRPRMPDLEPATSSESESGDATQSIQHQTAYASIRQGCSPQQDLERVPGSSGHAGSSVGVEPTREVDGPINGRRVPISLRHEPMAVMAD